MTIEEFGASVKTKFPQYSQYSDIEVGERMLKKFPQYQNRITDKPTVEKKEPARIPVATTAIEKLGDFFFGSTAKTVGGLITRGIGGIKQFTADTPEEKAEAKRLQRVGKDVGPVDIAFTGLELFPGGGVASQFFKKLPGGTKTLGYVNRVFKEIPEGALRKSVVEQFEKTLAPTKQKFKALTTKLAERGAERLPISSTRERLLGKVESRIYQAGEAVDEALKNIDGATKIKIAPILEDIEKAKQKFIVTGEQGRQFVADDIAVKQLDNISKKLQDFAGQAEDVSFSSLQALKTTLDNAITEGKKDFGRILAGSTELSSQRQLANAIRNELASDFPELAKVNKEYNFWRGIGDVLEETVQRTTGRGVSLGRKVTAVAGGQLAGIPGLLSAVGADKLFSSTAWRTLDIRLKSKLADAIASGQKSQVLKVWNEILRRLTTGTRNLLDED